MTVYYDISQACFNWCKEQHFAYQNNIQVQDLSLIALALFSLLLNHLINSYSDFIIKHTEITYEQLEMLYIGTSYFAFFLLAVFLIYYVGFK